MSALPQAAARTGAARAYPLPARPAVAPPPRLRVVGAPAQARSRVPFVLACMAVLGGALLAALLLNTQMASLAFERYELSNELGRLRQDRMDLVAQHDARSSPTQLAAEARSLGMVEANGTGWLRLADGSVQGAPAPAGG
ncbi:hypothetical protein [Cellulomonas dongxiuzhuiae]|uniref:Cell division protein FtsL n=1 Tax=Cellulomonas dongxiuzhuiae TaxID=2819979 RepID=A0ABX8GPK6_9CELL|nr:hypothetical protein [Cellulomonas dongxiuzhuiae]MBO3087455.1 hypothetical protein [Cellulomonas dongxiuzhuiae]MBO3096186.1 hypothetical protein [Cellulomonas dongxiuzhuiae]QWC17451.1 hypothetical protein KKR89_07740 [Cellulomonas dongxiuzhuiae]